MNNTNFTDYLNYNFLNNLLRQNYGKNVKIYTSIEDNKEFEGIIELVGDNYIVISNPDNEKWCLIFLTKINYIKFLEKMNINTNFYS